MADIFADNATLNTASSSGTDAPGSGTSQTWSVAALSGVWPGLSGGETMTLQDPAQPGELVRLTASSGSGDTSVAVIRGADGTTPVIHATGATFYCVTVSSFLNSLITSGALAAFTAAGQLFVGTGAGTGEVLAIGSTNAVLMVGGSDPSGLEWQSLGVETVNVVAVSGSSKTLSLVGNDETLSANCTFAMPTAVRGGWCYALVRQAATGGPFTATFTSVKWPSSSAPTMSTGASAVDRYDFVSDGTHWYGVIAGQAFG